MKIVETVDSAYAHIDNMRRERNRIGLVPTMGALHDGHLSIVQRSKQECEFTAVSIFVNPTQFGPHEDFAKYPRPLEDDLVKLRDLGVDLVFTPAREQLYPDGFSCHVGVPRVAEPLEGVCRPGHFQGVTTIVLKLFQILPATVAYFGQKDYQQLAVIRQMVDDLNVPIRVEGCETIREADGLAMSSRNRYLSPEQRDTSLGLWRSLQQAREMLASGETSVKALEASMQEELYRSGVDSIDYARVVDSVDLSTIEQVESSAVALIAARVGATRLIDNLVLQ